MSTSSILFDGEVIHAAFRAASAEQESLDAQLSESLTALAAYQSHLDGWQQQLASERVELQLLRELTERERAAAQQHEVQAAAQSDAELAALRQTIGELDERRAELAAELELARARSSELQSALEGHQRATDEERTKWEQESQRLHELLTRCSEASEPAPPGGAAASPPAVEPPLPAVSHRESSSGAVLGSIVEQFGKLRQQRAMDRQGSKKTR